VYAAAARYRRRYYARRSFLPRRLARPVISIGNLAVGGRAKTPVAALVAERLRARGERPAILSRGYARRDAADGVVVVRDPGGIRADLDRAGDEPLMLARRLDGVAVLASGSRYLAGRLAEHHFGCTVHVLDDGFQHFDLDRDADLVVLAPEDLADPRTLPSGRLREPLDAASAADAFIALDGADVERVADGRPFWHARRRMSGAPAGPALAVAGIANPRQFIEGLRAAGCAVVSEIVFPDHHRYSSADARRIVETARASNAREVVTTEKDLVRLLPFRPFACPVTAVALTIDLDDPVGFERWLAAAIAGARG
jgi:tetraacyldisaccharide 4'-kinase